MEKLGFDQRNWLWSILAGTIGFDRFWPKKLGLVDFGRNKVGVVEFDCKNWVLTKETGFGRRWPKKLGFYPKKWVRSIWAEKSGSSRC